MLSSLQRVDKKSGKKKTDDKALLRQRAQTVIAAERAKVKGPTEQMNSVANSQVWRYAAMAGIAVPLGGVAGLVMSRWPSVGGVGMFAALFAGFNGGGIIHGIYIRKLQLGVAQVIDQSVETLTALDQKDGLIITDYYNEISTLQKMRDGLNIPAAVLESVEEDQQEDLSQSEILDRSVDKIIAAYERRRAS